jgi:signal transduction histidine kinase
MRLTLVLVLVALATILIALALLTFTWAQRSGEEMDRRQGPVAQAIAEILAQRYNAEDEWTPDTIDAMPSISELANDMGIEVMAADGTVVYSDRSFDPNYRENLDLASERTSTAPIMVDDVQVGTVSTFPLSNAAISQSGGDLRIDVYVAILIAGFIAVTLAGLFGVFFSRVFTRPLSLITAVSNEVRSGNISARTNMEGHDEFSRLGRALDEMIDAIEKNENLEHQLTTDVAHELRTPLMAMRATIEAMMDGVLPMDAARLATLNSEVVRLGRLVDVQLELARLESAKTALRVDELNVSQLVKDLIVSHEMFIEEAGLILVDEIEPGIMVCGDADLLRQAISNLLSNAARYTPADGCITVRVCSRRNLAQVFVSDTGVGIATEDISHVFSRFWRAATSRDRESGGLGVGLALVKEIATRHHGLVSVESELGRGSTFTLSLPLLGQLDSDSDEGLWTKRPRQKQPR